MHVARGRYHHTSEWIAVRGVESSGDDDQIWSERFHHGLDDDVKRGQVIGVSQALLRPRNVHIRTAFTNLRYSTRARVKSIAVSMQRYVHDALIFVHDVLDAITVVHVPIDYQDSLAQFCLDHRSCSHDGVIKKTKSHGLSAHRVMSRWSHHRERSVYVSSPHRQTRLRDRPRRHARPLRRMLREEDVIAEHVLASHNLYLLSIDVERRIDERHVFLRVRARQLRLRRLSRLQPFASQIQFLRLDLIHDDPMSRRLFEVSLLFVHFHRVVVKQPHAALRRRFVALELHRGHIHIRDAHRARVRVLPQRRRCLHARDRMLFVLARGRRRRARRRATRDWSYSVVSF